MVARGCWIWIAVPILISLSLSLIPGTIVIQVVLFLLSVAFLIFFRDPYRNIPKNPKAIVSPADGIVIKKDIIGNFQRIAIFMRPYDVHINRAPLEGNIIEIKKISGGKKPAYKDYSENNERVITKMKTKIGPVNVVQITGIVARKIENYLISGQWVEKGQRVGIIKFSSRCDIYLPKNKVITKIKLGDKVKAGLSTLAVIK